ncbi:MFS transporter [Rhizomonospora bruguierae]|uniref:MFS transporter n=1 Tax=Rhizomonospora bruguierae TaxID=1581705 RepID=UPI001BCCDB3C|nr:MFS transporter [Micromonospora sp. NBRC 107566]
MSAPAKPGTRGHAGRAGAEEDRVRLAAVGALLALSAAMFCYVTAESLPIGLLQIISADLRVSPSAVGALVTGYGVVVALTSVPLTMLARRVPRRLLLSVTLAGLVLSTVVSVLRPSFPLLLGARVVTALTQAVFWSVVGPAAVGLFPARLRGRVLAVLFTGASLALVLGVPATTWLGQQAGWRAASLAVAGLGLVALVPVAVLLPTAPPDESHAALGRAPDRRRYSLLLGVTLLAVTGVFTSFTYVTEYLTGVAGYPAAALGPLLFIRGLAGLAGAGVAGVVVDRGPRRALTGAVALMAASLAGMWATGPAAVPTMVMLCVSAVAMSLIAPGLQTRVLDVAPGRSDVAAAGMSAVFNVGIAAGALLGGVLLPLAGVRSTALVGALLTAGALGLALAEPRPGQRISPRSAGPRPAA